MRKIMLVLLIAAASAFGQTKYKDFQTISSSGSTVTFQDNSGSGTITFEYGFNGATPSTMSITVQGCGQGGTCTNLTPISGTNPYTGTTTTQVQFAGGYAKYQVTATWTGSVVVNVWVVGIQAKTGGGITGVTAGGDLSGTYPNPTVAQVNGAAVPASAPLLSSNSSRQLILATQANFNTYLTGPGPVGGTTPNSVAATVLNFANTYTTSANGINFGDSNLFRIGTSLVAYNGSSSADVGISVSNLTNATAADSFLRISNNNSSTSALTLLAFPAARTASGMVQALEGYVSTGTAMTAGLALGTETTAPLKLFYNSSEKIRVQTGVSIGNTTDPGTNNLSVSGTTGTSQIIFTGTAPTMAAGAAAGTSPTCTSITGTNMAGVITCTTGTSTTTGTLATVTFNGTLGTAPQGCRLQPRDATTAPISTSTYTTAPSTTTWTIGVGTALTASTTYVWSYGCI